MAIRIFSSAQILATNILTSGPVIPSSGVTIMTWMKKNDWVEGGINIKSLIGSYNVSASSAIQLGINQDPNTVCFWNWGGNVLVSYPSSSLISGQWYHLCYVYNNVNSLFYINGELVNTTTVIPQGGDLNRVQVNSYPSLLPFTFSGSEISNEFEVDDYRVYNRPLSQDEVRTIYNLRGKDADVYRLVFHYTFDELPVNTFVSASYNHTNILLTLVNITAQPIFIEKIIYNIR